MAHVLTLQEVLGPAFFAGDYGIKSTLAVLGCPIIGGIFAAVVWKI